MTGKFLKSVIIDSDDLRRNANYKPFGENILAMHANYGETPFSYTIFDSKFKTVSQHIKPVQYIRDNPDIVVSPGSDFCHYVYNNQVYVRNNNLNDTLYVIENTHTFTPKYIINEGKYKVTTEILRNEALFKRSTMLSVSSIFELKDYLFIRYGFHTSFYTKPDNFFCYYDKTKQDFFLFPSSPAGIKNDYDGGLDFWPQEQRNNVFYTFYDAYLFEENLKKTNKVQPKGPEGAVKLLNDFSRKIDPEDNPVLVIVRLKK
jgi:hypothetical protein